MISHEEIATRTSIGFYMFSPPGENERLIQRAGFRLITATDTTESAAGVARRWRDARERRRGELIRAERNSREVALTLLRNAERKPWFDLVYLPRAADLTSDPEHNSYRKEMDDDPTVTLRTVRVPLLVLYGDSDPWIPVAKSVAQLRSIGDRMTNLTYAVVVNANHEMMFPRNETMQVDEESVRNNAPQAPEYFMLLGSWLSRHLGY